MKSSLKISNSLKTQRDLKKINVEPNQIVKKDSLYRKRKKESSRNEKKRKKKKTMERFGETKKREVQDESDTWDKNIVEGVVQKCLVFFEKHLNRFANLDQKTCKKKTLKEKLGKDSITSSLYKINKCKLSKVRQSKPCDSSRSRSWLSCCKNSKVVYFK